MVNKIFCGNGEFSLYVLGGMQPRLAGDLVLLVPATSGQLYLPKVSNIAPDFKNPSDGVLGLMRLNTLEPPPVFRYQAPPSGFLLPHHVAQGLQQEHGKLLLEASPPFFSQLRGEELSGHLHQAREALASELTRSVAQRFKPILSRRLGFVSIGENEDNGSIYDVGKSLNLGDMPKVRTRKNVKHQQSFVSSLTTLEHIAKNKKDMNSHQKPPQTTIETVEQKSRTRKDAVKDSLPQDASLISTGQSFQNPSAASVANTENQVTSFKLISPKEDDHQPPSLVTSPFAEAQTSTISLKNKVHLGRNYAPSANAYTHTSRFGISSQNNPDSNSNHNTIPELLPGDHLTTSGSVEPPIYISPESAPEENYPSKIVEGSAYSDKVSVKGEVELDERTTLKTTPHFEVQNNPFSSGEHSEVSTDHLSSSQAPLLESGKEVNAVPGVTQISPIIPSNTHRPLLAQPPIPGSVAEVLPVKSLSNLKSSLPVLSQSTQGPIPSGLTPVKPPLAGVGAPVPVIPSPISPVYPSFPNAIFNAGSSPLTPFQTSSPLVTPFSPYTTLFQPPLSIGDGFSRSISLPAYNIPIGGRYFN
ncbi:hypothetical protein SK128_003197 [Halocaridina rubra]|uniref:Uncharacterized protein n=1 Tax=Halocaridina rubra TaxID=373956 RepID=A0AAN8WMD8_HALRR